MGGYEVNLVDDEDPVWEAAYARIWRLVQANRAFLNAIVTAPPGKLEGNWKLALIRKHRDIVRLKEIWTNNVNFQLYLEGKLARQLGMPYTKQLVSVFLK